MATSACPSSDKRETARSRLQSFIHRSGRCGGKCRQGSIGDPAAWERADYITMLPGYPDQVHTEAH